MSLKKKAPKRAAVPDKITPTKVGKPTPKKVEKPTPKKVEKPTPKKVEKPTPKKVEKATPKKVEIPSKKSKMDKSKTTVATPKKEEKALKVEFNSDYDLNQSKVSKVLKALLKIHNSEDIKTDVTGEKKSQLFGAEETPVNMQITGIKVAKESRKQVLKLVLPHSPIVDKTDVCIIVKDLEKGLKVDHESSVNHFKDLLSEKGVEVSSVISLRELKVDYKTFESKTALCHRHEIFLADDRIMRFLPKFLGKSFYSRKKFPMPINMTSPNLAKIVQKALQTVTLPLHNQGVCTMVRLGHTNMPENHLIDNILAASEILIKKYPGGFKNIRSLLLKTETSLALPLHMSTLSANEVGFVDTFKPKEEKKEDITDELSTFLNANVTVKPNFEIIVEGAGKLEDIEDASDEEAEEGSDDESGKKKDKEAKKAKKAEKKPKAKKGKKAAQDSDDSDDDIEEAENEYLNRVEDEENQSDQDEQNEEEQEGEEEDEEDGEDEEDNDAESEDEDEAESESEEEEIESASEDDMPAEPVKAKRPYLRGKNAKKQNK